MIESSANEPLGEERETDLGNHGIPADESPVPAGPATVLAVTSQWQGPDRLVLRAPLGCSVISFVLTVLVIITPWLVLVLNDKRFQGNWVPILVTGLCMTATIVGLAWLCLHQTFLARVTFDKEAGLLSMGWRGRRGKRPLTSVIGVQVMQTRKQFGGPELNIPAAAMYQLNLILDDPAERRLNVSTCDPHTARSIARLIAEFLGVPVLDSARTPEAAAADSDAELTNWHTAVPSPVVIEAGPDVLLIRRRRFHGIMLRLIMGRRQARFDRAHGVLTLRNGETRPLSSVKAVEIVDGAIHQLNLLTDDPRQPRLNLIADADAGLVRRAGERIASFLGMTLLEAKPQTAAASDGVLTEHLAGLSTIPSPVVIEAGPDVLLMRPRRFSGLLGGSLTAMASSFAVLLSVLFVQGAALEWWTILVLVSFGFVVGVGSLNNLARRARFDRRQGVLTIGRRTKRPLSSVKAVEIVDRPEYRLNLVLDDPHQPRLNLITDMEAALVRKEAERLSAFLGVPLLEAKRQSGVGEAVNPLEELNRAPLPPGKATIRGPAHIVTKGDDGLVLRRRSPIKWTQLVSALFMIGLGIYLAWLAFGQAGLGQLADWLPFVLLELALLFAAMKPLLLYRDYFDRQARLLTLGWFGLKGTYPLENILAVQLVPGGLVVKTDSWRGGECVSYQMNLVMASTYLDRLNLTADSDLAWTRQAGRQIADFLGVPLIDQIAEGQ